MMQGIIATPNGDIWALDIEKGQVVHLPQGDPEKAEFIFVNKTGKPFKNPGKLLAPFSLAIDQQNNIWVGNGAGHWVSRFSADDPTHTLKTFDTGYSISGLAIDSKGNVWIANRLGNSMRGWWSWVRMLFKAKGGGNPDPYLTTTMSRQKPGYWSGGSLTVLSSDGKQLPFSPITGKGLAGPWAVVVDGDDNVWVNNLVNSKCGIVELCGANPKAWPPGKKMATPSRPKAAMWVAACRWKWISTLIPPATSGWAITGRTSNPFSAKMPNRCPLLARVRVWWCSTAWPSR